MNAPDTIKLPPHSVDAEQSVLGGILLAGQDALDRIEGMLTEDDFYRQEHRQIFAAVRTLGNRGSAIDVITSAEALDKAGRLERAGGLPYLASLAQNTPTAANIASYAKTLQQRALQRRLLVLAGEIQESCYAPGADVEEIIAKADAGMAQLLDTGTDEPTSLVDAMNLVVNDIDDRITSHRPSGLKTGIEDLDAITSGLEPGQLVIAAARPSVGKTAFAINVVDHVVRDGETVAFFSLEMTRKEISQRMLSLRTGISVARMRSGQISDGEFSRISDCRLNADKHGLFLIDRSAIGVSYVRAAARKIKRKHGLSLIVLDYLGLMRGEGQNRTQEIGSLSRGLKALAKELNIPIIVLAQLNRATETRQDKRPQLSDLRDSGEVEQDADIVVMLHREELYSSDPSWHGIAELIVRKNRNGPLGDVTLNFDHERMQFRLHDGMNPRSNQRTAQSSNRGGFQ